jgi:hypothetical protein
MFVRLLEMKLESSKNWMKLVGRLFCLFTQETSGTPLEIQVLTRLRLVCRLATPLFSVPLGRQMRRQMVPGESLLKRSPAFFPFTRPGDVKIAIENGH